MPDWPRWAVAISAAWLGLVALASVVAPDTVACGFRRLTGIPCPGCGLTRGVTAIAHGDIARGFAHNPLLLAALVLFAALAALRVVAGRAPRLRPTRAWLLPALLLLAANWAYVIRTDRPVASLERRHVAPGATQPTAHADTTEPAQVEQR